MEDFKEIFGHYLRSVGSWFIDAHTLRYMYEEYGIVGLIIGYLGYIHAFALAGSL